MPNLNINSGEIKLTVNDDKNRVIRFNPNDIGFAERFYNLLTEFETKQKEYAKRAEKLDQNTEVDEFGIRKNTKEGLALVREICEDIKTQIDSVFGEGTSKTAFGDTVEIDMFEQFFEGLTPFIQNARTKKIQKYAKNGKSGVMR